MPAAIMRAALPKTLAEEEHAEETTTAGPFKFRVRCTKSASEKLFCVSA
jgi:hypothetical protein